MALGNSDFYGTSPAELDENVPVTRDYSTAKSDLGANIGIGWEVNVTLELSWDVPLYKNAIAARDVATTPRDPREGPLHHLHLPGEKGHRQHHVPEPQLHLCARGRLPVLPHLTSRPSNSPRVKRATTPSTTTPSPTSSPRTNPYFNENPSSIKRFIDGWTLWYQWYHAGDGKYGGLGNPIIPTIDPTIPQVYI